MTFSFEKQLAWNALLDNAIPRIAKPLARLAAERGLAVTDALSGATTAIPVSATPVVIPGETLTHRQWLASQLASAGLKMATAVMDGMQREVIAGGLSTLEATLAQATYAQLKTLVNTRVDFFVSDSVKALELNATIPAMQGYSDIAAHTLIEVLAQDLGLNTAEIARLQAANGSNALALLEALRAGFQKVRATEPRRIALLCRRNDAQLTEQQYLAKQFTDFGIDAEVVFPDQLSGSDGVKANGQRYDLICRHLFIRRLDEPSLVGADYVKGLLLEPNDTRAVVFNPPATHVEAKSAFALLSESLDSTSLQKAAGLTEPELRAIAESVPWTRLFRGSELVAKVAAHPERYVLKRSWDYGGRAVFVGPTAGTPGFEERTKTAFGQTLSWAETCQKAAEDKRGGGFIVQEMVTASAAPYAICGPEGATVTSLYVDFSTYASVGLEQQPKWGGVCRGSVSPIVNIVGGGGVLPLLTEEVAGRFLDLAQRLSR